MSKRAVLKRYWFVFFVGLVLFLAGGCEEFAAEEDFYQVWVAPQKLRQIEVLDLAAAEVDERPKADVNEPVAAERELTLEQCRALALANNLDIKVELISPAIAAEQVGAEQAKFEWAFFSNVGYRKTDTPTSTTLSGSKVDFSRVELGVEVPLRTGGTLTFDAVDSRTKTNNVFSTLNPSYDTDFSVSISQPLLRNAGKRTNTHSIRIAEYERQIVGARTKLEVIRVIAGVDRVYWRLYAARKELDVRRQQYELASAQLEKARRFVDSGEMAQVEIIRAEAGIAQRLEGIILAENNLQDRQRELKGILNQAGLEMQTPTVVVPTTEPEPVHYELEEQRLVAAAVENRMEMLELELRIAQDVSTIDYRRNQALPLVTLDYAYNINGLGTSRGRSFDLLFDKRFEDHRLGLGLLVPLGNEAARSRLRQAFYYRQQRLTTRQNRRILIEIEVLNAIDQLEANWQRILAGRQNAILAARLYEAEKRQFELGLRTSTDVLDAQTDFSDAQSAEILALAEYQIAMVDLAFATGTLLGASGVQLEPIVPEVVIK